MTMVAAPAFNGIGALCRLQDSVIAEMISAVDSPEYPRIALGALHRLLPADAAAMYVYSGDDLAYILDEDLRPLVDHRFAMHYRQATYRLNPFFQHHRVGLVSGVYTMDQLAQARSIKKPIAGTGDLELVELDETEEIGYRTSGFPKRYSELAIAVRLSARQTVQISFYRSGRKAFVAGELSMLKGLIQTLTALYGRFWQYRELNSASGDNALCTALQSLSGGTLSNRERQVTLLDLNGGDARHIADTLGISEQTVKTHRKKAFAKLGVNTKAKLFLAILHRLIRLRAA